MTSVNPKEFSKHETQNGPARRLFIGFKATIPMQASVEEFAHEHRVSQSTVIRHAIAEYMEKRGQSAFVAP